MATRAPQVDCWDDEYDSDATIRPLRIKKREGLTKASSPTMKASSSTMKASSPTMEGASAKKIDEEVDDSPYDSENEVGLGLSFYHNRKKSTEFNTSSAEHKREDKGKGKALEADDEAPALDPDARAEAKVVEDRIRANRVNRLSPAPWLNTNARPRPIQPTRSLRPFAPPSYGNCATFNPPKPRPLQRIMADHFGFEHPPRPQTPQNPQNPQNPQTPPSPRPRRPSSPGEFSSEYEETFNQLLTETLRSQAESLGSSSSGKRSPRSPFPRTPNLSSARSASAPVSGNPFGSSRQPSSGSAAAPAARNASTSSNTYASATTATIETPTHQGQPLTARNLATLRATSTSSHSLQTPLVVPSAPRRNLSGPSFGVALLPYCDQEGSGPLSPATFGHRVFSYPIGASQEEIVAISRSPSVAVPSSARGPLYFTEAEREALDAIVEANLNCPDHHRDCNCIDIEYAYNELRVMPATMSLEERQRIINDNRSLRNIKNELESLLENGTITDEIYDTVMTALPTESPLNSAASRSNATSASIPTHSFNNMSINDPPPPAYTTPTPPSLPSRGPSQAPPKPEIARVVALYRYTEPEDCTFEVGDVLSVHDYMNAEWWFGTNLRTNREGVFPVNYVKVQSTSPQEAYGDEKEGVYGGSVAPAPGPGTGPSNSYTSSVPSGPPSKGQENAKKFGKKLGNAAVFGAGATLGGKLVNSIF